MLAPTSKLYFITITFNFYIWWGNAIYRPSQSRLTECFPTLPINYYLYFNQLYLYSLNYGASYGAKYGAEINTLILTL